MNNNKKGISLIVLIITIIVIIILAGAVILSLNNTNMIKNSNDAVLASDKANVQAAVTLFLTNEMMAQDGSMYKLTVTPGDLSGAGVKVNKTKLTANGVSSPVQVDMSYTTLKVNPSDKGTFTVDAQGNVSVKAKYANSIYNK